MTDIPKDLADRLVLAVSVTLSDEMNVTGPVRPYVRVAAEVVRAYSQELEDYDEKGERKRIRHLEECFDILGDLLDAIDKHGDVEDERAY